MKLSIVIPCYNKSSYLIDMIKSIIRQTFKDWELILVDDGSDDNNFKVIRDFVLSDSRIKLVQRSRPPKNGNTCRNIGMKMSQGEYLMFFDSDDLLSDTCFEHRVKYMDAHPDIDYATFPTSSFIDGIGINTPRKFDSCEQQDLLANILSADYPFTVWSNIYRRSTLTDISWDEKVFLYQDFDFMVQCELKGLVHGWSNEAETSDYFYRIFKDGNSVCQKVVSEKKVHSTNYLFNKIYHQINELDEKIRLDRCFLRFILLYFEQILLAYNKQFVFSFLDTISKLYPKEYIFMKKIVEWRDCHQSKSHFTLMHMYAKLYRAFHISIHKSFMIHEFGKGILNIK